MPAAVVAPFWLAIKTWVDAMAVCTSRCTGAADERSAVDAHDQPTFLTAERKPHEITVQRRWGFRRNALHAATMHANQQLRISRHHAWRTEDPPNVRLAGIV